MRSIKITETILRDAHQSLIATRMTTDQMIPVLEKLDNVGFYALECWGGATYDASLRFLNENPWVRLREIRKRVKKTNLMMLLRGQNILGYKHYPDDIVEEFVKRAVGNGIDIIRVFDALNDIRNVKTAILATKKEGAHAQAAISYTISPVHSNEMYANLARDLEQLGADSICIKDMSGLLKPYVAYDLVKAIKAKTTLEVEVHCHYTSGLASMTYIKSIEAGADIVDTAMSPLALGTSQPATEPFVAALKGTEFDTNLDLEELDPITKYFSNIRQESLESGLLDPKVLGVDINALIYQVPGGMLSNLVSQLKAQRALHRFNEVLNEVPKVREDMGFPPLVTPTSQIVGTQAVLNVITGERYKMVPNEIKEYVRGMYGKPPVAIKKDIIKKIIGDEEVVTCRPADLLEPSLKVETKQIARYMQEPEDVLSYALFPQVALDYFRYRQAKEYEIDKDLVSYDDSTYPI